MFIQADRDNCRTSLQANIGHDNHSSSVTYPPESTYKDRTYIQRLFLSYIITQKE
jgi:hypothetical protein